MVKNQVINRVGNRYYEYRKILKEKAAKLSPKVDCKLEQAMLDFPINLPVKNVEKFKITNQLHKFYIYLGL